MHRDSAAVVGSRGWPNRIRHHCSTNTEYVIIDIIARAGRTLWLALPPIAYAVVYGRVIDTLLDLPPPDVVIRLGPGLVVPANFGARTRPGFWHAGALRSTSAEIDPLLGHTKSGRNLLDASG